MRLRHALFGTLLLSRSIAVAGDEDRQWSPDHRRYVVARPGETLEKGQERARLLVYSASDGPVAVAHVWIVEPDGTMRAGIRGCERWGWLDDRRVYCAGSVDPNTTIALIFDAATGSELREDIPAAIP